jgi:hypothetical protein
MKITCDIALETTPEAIWAILSDVAAYSEWNPMIKAIVGSPAPLGTVQVTIFYPGEGTTQSMAEVTGWMPPKYFSFSFRKGPAWWYQEEHVFRIRQREDGKVVFHNETYATGLSLRFGRKDAAHRMRHAMDRMNEELKEKLLGPAPST